MIISTVGCNLADSPPFASLHRADLAVTDLERWQQCYDRGIAHEEKNELETAVAAYLEAAAIDATFADLHYRVATCYRRLDDIDRARDHYVKAREYDTLRFRVDRQINEIIGSVATAGSGTDVRFVDAAAAVQTASPRGIPGATHFHEHVHMKFAGNYLVARAILAQAEGFLPEHVRSRKAPDAEDLTEKQCRDRLVYSLFTEIDNTEDVLNSFIKRPPFTNQIYHEQQVARLEAESMEMQQRLLEMDPMSIDAQFKEAIARTPGDWWLHWSYGDFLSGGLGDAASAARQFRIVRDTLPFNSQIHAELGLSLGMAGDLDAAIELNMKAIRLDSSNAVAHYNLGLAYQMRGDNDKAIKHYESALSYEPGFGEAHNNRAGIFFKQGKVEKAINAYLEAQEHVIGFSDLYYNLGVIYDKQGQKDAAVEQLRKALEIAPGSAKVRKQLDDVLRRQ